MKTNNTIEKMDKRVGESLRAIVPRIRGKLKQIEQITKRATWKIGREIGKELITARKLCEKAKTPFRSWISDNFELSDTMAFNYIKIAEDKSASHYPSISEHLRKFRPTYGLPRQSVSDIEEEAAGKTILDGISNGIFIERTLNVSKEKELKKKVAVQLVDAGFRALSIKAHSDKGGSDEAMRRITEVRAALKDAIEDGDVYL